MVPRILITRRKWNAGEPRYTEPLEHPVSKVNLFHCNLATVRDIPSGLEIVKKMQFMDTYACQFPDIAFNFMIGHDGTVYEGRGWHVVNENIDPDETGRHRPRSLDIGLLSDFKEPEAPPQIAQAINDIMEYGIDHNYITKDFNTKMVANPMPLWTSINLPVPIVSREAWGALEPTSEEPLVVPVKHVNLLSSGTRPCFSKKECIQAMQDMQKRYMEEEGLPDIPYNFLVGGDGNAYEGRGFTTNPSKIGPSHVFYEGKSLDIAYIVYMPPRKASVAAFDLIDYGEGSGFVEPMFGMDITVCYKHDNMP